MKEQKVYMKLWLIFHKRNKISDTDSWYLDFANCLLPVISEFPIYKEETEKYRQIVAVKFALYLEDCVADGGNWRQFIHWCKKSYGRFLPFYTLSEDYLVDEINREDIAFLLWSNHSLGGELYTGVENPLDVDMLEFADRIYELMSAVFEEAPISDELAAEWLIKTAIMEKPCTPLPVVLPGEKLPESLDEFLRASGGESLMYFDSYERMKLFLVQELGWKDEKDSLLSDLEEFFDFVLYSNPKGLLIGMDVAAYIADSRNPSYNQTLAEEESYELFCDQGLCPFDLLKYCMENDLLPDAQFPFEDGKRLLHENWDFVTRWFLDDYYEGN